ncbi:MULTISPECIES: zinc ABC transporter substrate-binding protein ZnuA [Aeromonas]|uniref:High-affinity zinc uptake system protein ZnuA n=1 Tax=Aeromonas veronii TaxID=654 RepID=A0AAW5MB25_AERVE|nr:zinc ABC transporter substrate-binding protein ZnuA [Aeromonas veronii]HDT6077291.1 zinc ABC transporter substrate-binding protein ZnuA [Aeromonas veronii bv. veronii]MBL0489353.1 zinc ABC transporter substrate-binding protein ZnuA [Aeromonas veronii]MBL0503964.1 zinc ABC transporter substrate-binding protein ZnuA [Aeromonas veronii]MBL0643265.1 zinc ABC transporter substrate-binding protein ZnuA [Aeromonas veronii]MCR4448645.1 zinc ABC transporter substrate-binding protein ZnuA [Aeromonas 
MRIIALFTALLAVSLPVRAIEVLTTIKPLGFIAAAITDGVSEPKVLLPTGASPHDFSLRPSDIRSINSADLVVWVGPELEGFMAKPLANHPHALALTQVEGMPLFNYATQDSHDSHDHDDHDHAAHEHGNHDHDEGHEGHHHEGVDPHIWLGPTQAKVIAKAIASELGKLDPANQARYDANLAAFVTKVDAKDKVIAGQMKAVNEKGYFVFHEAYGYWERHYGMSSKGHFTVSPERRPGAKTLVDIRKALEEKQASCIYAEPQFSPAVIESVARNTGAKVLLLDEVGEQVPLGPDGYPQFMQQLADAFAQCR